MSDDANIEHALAAAVRQAAAHAEPLAIRGAGSKRAYTGERAGTPLAVGAHRGIVSYEPTELVITARAGTPLAEIEAALADRDQMLGFEPPHLGAGATLGGTLACGWSGPRRPYAGAARDFVLGTRVINGQGEILRFGGQVMKNVAGFDVSRLLVGSFGTLGVLLEASLRVLPRPAQEITLRFEMNDTDAIGSMNRWSGQPLPLSAAAHSGESLYIRLSGSESGVRAARARLGGERVDTGRDFWEEVRELRRSFFQDARPLWRLAVPPATPPVALPGKWFLDWGGAQRWLVSEAAAAEIESAASRAGGHARRMRGTALSLASLSAPLQRLHAALRAAFDPQHLFDTSSASRAA